MKNRRDPFENLDGILSNSRPPDIYDNLRVAEPRRRNRRWEKEQNSRKAVYRGVDPKLALRVRELADEISVPAGEVARFLLEYALRAYNLGELELIPYPNPDRMRMTLFPDAEQTWRADLPYTPSKPKMKKLAGASWKVITTWRNMPPGLKGEISDLASEAGLDVPVGELVTALLRYSLKAYEYGLLKLEPVMSATGYTLQEGGEP